MPSHPLESSVVPGLFIVVHVPNELPGLRRVVPRVQETLERIYQNHLAQIALANLQEQIVAEVVYPHGYVARRVFLKRDVVR